MGAYEEAVEILLLEDSQAVIDGFDRLAATYGHAEASAAWRKACQNLDAADEADEQAPVMEVLLGGGLSVQLDKSNCIVLVKEMGSSITVRHTVTDVGALIAALNAALGAQSERD